MNNQFLHKLALAIVGVAVAGAWAFLTSRASSDDVKANAQAIVVVAERSEQAMKDHAEKAEGRLRSVESNVIVICEFLDRQDRDGGGPGIRCRNGQ